MAEVTAIGVESGAANATGVTATICLSVVPRTRSAANATSKAILLSAAQEVFNRPQAKVRAEVGTAVGHRSHLRRR